VQLLKGYNQKHLKTWEENLIYIQHYYNKAIHTSSGKSPFETCFAYFPPLSLDVVNGKQGVREEIIGETLKDEKFVEKIRQIHLQIQETLKKSQDWYKAIHDHHITDKTFKVADKVSF